METKRDIRSCSREELQGWLTGAGEPSYRADQVLGWVHRQWVGSWDEMTNLPRSLRERLSSKFRLVLPILVQMQGGGEESTRKFLWRLGDGALVESVLIPANPALYGDASDRHTLCVSTQVGCAYGCKFCASGLDGWKRNLEPDEILGQVVAVERWHRDRMRSVQEPEQEVEAGSAGSRAVSKAERLVNNLVIMGMGEPLANYDNLMRALVILNAPWGGGIGARKITVSTCGLVPEIRRLAKEPYQFGLAISLHGATDAVRGRIMPVNRKYPLGQLLPACEEYVAVRGRMITLEYILIDGVNDGMEQAPELAGVAKRLRAKVNLIPYNRVEGLDWLRPDEGRQEAFLARLVRMGVKATLRREKGHEIDAACGQLRLKVERNRSGVEQEATEQKEG